MALKTRFAHKKLHHQTLLVNKQKILSQPHLTSSNSSCNEISLLNFTDLCYHDVIIPKNTSLQKYIISLTSIPSRVATREFIEIIDHLFKQIICPTSVYLHLCKNYKRKFEYDERLYNENLLYIQNKYSNFYINYTEDYGPITKIMGILDIHDLQNDDIIIVCDDDWLYESKLIFNYDLCYQLYQCDAIFIDERNNIVWDDKFSNGMNIIYQKDLFYDNYQNFAYGWLSFSMKYKCIKNLKSFYNSCLNINHQVWKHDDLIITLFYKTENIYSCGMNILNLNLNRTKLDKTTCLRENNWEFRNQIEKEFLNLFNIPIIILNNHNYITNLSEIKFDNEISANINPRWLLFNVSNVGYDPRNNEFERKQLDFKYHTNNIMILTITYFCQPIKNDTINFMVNDKNITISLPTNSYSRKQSFFIKLNVKINRSTQQLYPFSIVQTAESSKISLYRFYSITTILNCVPNLNYRFFDKNSRLDYIKQYHPVIASLYENLRVGAYKADLFRALYIYNNGGLYMDCKNILYQPIDSYLSLSQFYVKDVTENYICNGLFFCHNSKMPILKSYLSRILTNLFMQSYENNFLSVTGPGLFGQYNPTPIVLQNRSPKDWKDSIMTLLESQIPIVKVSYSGYYDENNYLEQDHYSVLWNNRQVYLDKPFQQKPEQINGIDFITWINLDRSNGRRAHMEKLLENILVPSIRISGVDGKNDSIRDYLHPLTTKMSNGEIGNLLSHIKCISYLSKMEGNYFLVLEDDVSLDHTGLLTNNLQKIIEECPPFDVLQIYKTYDRPLSDIYTDWNNHLKSGNSYDNHIAGTAAYVISKRGIENIIKFIDYQFDQDRFIIHTNNISVTDIFLYSNVKTYAYKYNVFGLVNDYSEIHNNHIEWHKFTSKIQLQTIIEDLVI